MEGAMDAKGIKACLKTAREAIRNKDFKEALKQCKAVLVEDKDNYNALIFIGVATEGMNQKDQALKAYRKAAEHNPELLLAWQGLSGMLEKSPLLVETPEAFNIFEKLESLNSSGITKKIAYLHKVTELKIKSKDTDEAIESLQRLLVLEKDEEKLKPVLQQLLSFLALSAPNLPPEHLLMYSQTLNRILQFSSLTEEDILEQTERLLLLTSQTNRDNLEFVSEELRQRFPGAALPIEFLLQNLLDKSICSASLSSNTCGKIKELIAQLIAVKEDSSLVSAGQGYLLLKDRQFAKAKDVLQGIDSNCICGLYSLSQAYIGLHMYQPCLEACNKGLAACASSKRVLSVPAGDMVTLFRLAQAEAYRAIGTEEALDSSLAILDKVQESKPSEAFLIRAYIFLSQEKFDEAEKCIEHLTDDGVAVQTLQATILFAKKEYSESLKLLRHLVKEAPEDASATLLLGKVLWELRDSNEIEKAKEECFTTLLKAAKLDPNNYESFLYLGYFYNSIQQDLGKARRCFQKAYDLNPASDESGCSLVDVLVELDVETQSLNILKAVTEKAAAGRCKWAWLRLGLYQIKHENPSMAIISLQSALRADPNDCHVWESLADAYLQRGSITASLKAFAKASELDPQSLYCLYQIASIKQTLGSLTEAIEEYKNVLNKSDNYVPALKGLGESLIQLGKQNLYRCLDGLARDNFEEAIRYLTRAASQRPDLSCLWKLLGDASTFVYRLSAERFRIPSKLVDRGTHEQPTRDVTKAELLQIGARCYSQAVKILQDTGALWHDLSVNLYYQSQLATSSHKEEHDGHILLQRATQAIKKAIDLECNDWRHWNVLGVLSCSKLDHKAALAQHCFIRSIECEAKNVVAWTNLGTLYLSKGEIMLAHDAFSAAQSVDPTYMACWVGQALVAEAVGHEEAMDLFRHTTELGFHPESALGYGQWVLRVLGGTSKRDSDYFQYCIHQMAAVPAASDALTRYTARIKTNPVAYNMQGLLFEHQILLQSSVEALQKALTLLEQSDPDNSINDVRMNLARVLCKQGKYEDSVRQFQLCDLSASVEHMCLYGLALFHCYKLVESVNVYQLALGLLGDSPKVSQVYTALGMVAYKLGDLDGAKSHLFDGFQTSHPSPRGVLALCALGLLQKDLTLASAVFEELFKQGNKEKFLKDILLLQTYTSILKGDTGKAESNLRKEIEENPSNASLWSLLAVLILTQNKDGGASVAECASSALALVESGDGQTERRLISLGQLLAGHHHRQHSDKNAQKAAQKAFHLNPGCMLTLSTLACAVHAEALVRRSLTGEEGLFTVGNGLLNMLLKQGELNDELEIWVLQQLVVNCIEVNDISRARVALKSLLDKNEKSPETEAFAKSVSMFLSSTVDEKILADTPHKLQILVSYALYCHNNKNEEAATFLQKMAEQPNVQKSPSVVVNLLERAALAAFSALQAEPGNSSLKEKFDNVVKYFKDKEVPSAVSSFLRALLAMDDNKRLARHLLTTASGNIDASRELGYCSSLIKQALEGLNLSSTNN